MQQLFLTVLDVCCTQVLFHVSLDRYFYLLQDFQNLVVYLNERVIGLHRHHFAKHFESVLTIVQWNETSRLLVEWHSCHLNLVGIVVGFKSVIIRASRHEQIAGKDMDISIHSVSHYELLKV
jgi:hypothetical protein